MTDLPLRVRCCEDATASLHDGMTTMILANWYDALYHVGKGAAGLPPEQAAVSGRKRNILVRESARGATKEQGVEEARVFAVFTHCHYAQKGHC